MQKAVLARRLNLAAVGSLLFLIALCIAWELWLAPLRPGGSWLVVKAFPLLAPLHGILHARRYTHQWASMLSLAYLVEGIVRAGSDAGASQWLATIEVAAALTFFAAAVAYSRVTSKASPTA